MSARPKPQVRDAYTQRTSMDLICGAFDEQFRDHASKAKAVANSAGPEASARTAEKWIRKESAPSLHAFLNMLIGPKPIPALQAEVRRLLAATQDHELDPSRAIAEMHQTMRALRETVNLTVDATAQLVSVATRKPDEAA